VFHEDKKKARFLESKEVASNSAELEESASDDASSEHVLEGINVKEEGEDFAGAQTSSGCLENSDRPSVVQGKLKEILAQVTRKHGPHSTLEVFVLPACMRVCPQARQDIKSMYDVSVKVPKTAIRNTFSTGTKTWYAADSTLVSGAPSVVWF
jgi:hypothetical protein